MGLPPPPAAAAATRAAAVAPAAVAAAALRGLGDLDLDLATIDILTVEARDGLLGVLLARHLHEAEAPRPTGVAVGHHAGRFDAAVGSEDFAQTITRRGKGEATNEELHGHLAHLGLPHVRHVPVGGRSVETRARRGGPPSAARRAGRGETTPSAVRTPASLTGSSGSGSGRSARPGRGRGPGWRPQDPPWSFP